VPVIAWNRDGPSNKGEKAWRLWLLHHVEYFNIYATHTLQDSAGFGSRILYLPNAAWDTEYQLGGVTLEALRDASRYERDVSFFGRINASRYPEMREREAFFRRLGSRLAALGVAYAFIDDPLSYAQQRKLIQTSRINLSFFAGCDACYHGAGDPSREKSWGMPERCFGVPACGGFLLSDTRKHARDDFSPGRDWVDFVDLDDCIEKIRYYLAAFAENRVIAEAAYARVLREHTYVHRARALIDAASEWREARAMTRERHGIHLP
jgi:spore maturation protein CgeB